MIGHRLPSTGVTPLPWYYAVIRLPIRHLVSLLFIACWPYSHCAWKSR